MWARIVEIMLGCWLAVSPFVFRHPVSERGWWANDLVCAFLTVLFSLVSFWPPANRIHLLLLGVALWLIGFGYFAGAETSPPALQNNLLIGLLLAMLAIIPT